MKLTLGIKSGFFKKKEKNAGLWFLNKVQYKSVCCQMTLYQELQKVAKLKIIDTTHLHPPPL